MRPVMEHFLLESQWGLKYSQFIQGVFCDFCPPKVKVWKTKVRWIHVDVDRPSHT